jgi:hypothetical protein
MTDASLPKRATQIELRAKRAPRIGKVFMAIKPTTTATIPPATVKPEIAFPWAAIIRASSLAGA